MTNGVGIASLVLAIFAISIPFGVVITAIAIIPAIVVCLMPVGAILLRSSRKNPIST